MVNKMEIPKGRVVELTAEFRKVWERAWILWVQSEATQTFVSIQDMISNAV